MIQQDYSPQRFHGDFYGRKSPGRESEIKLTSSEHRRSVSSLNDASHSNDRNVPVTDDEEEKLRKFYDVYRNEVSFQTPSPVNSSSSPRVRESPNMSSIERGAFQSPRNPYSLRRPSGFREFGDPIVDLSVAPVQFDVNSSTNIALCLNQLPSTSLTSKRIEGIKVKIEHDYYIVVYGLVVGVRFFSKYFEYLYPAQRNEFLADYYTEELEVNFLPEGSQLTNVLVPPHDLQYSFQFKEYMPKVFKLLRRLAGIDTETYVNSVASDFNFIDFISRKNCSFSYYSGDGKLFVKAISKKASKFLRRIMQAYSLFIEQNPHSLLSRFFGLYRVRIGDNSSFKVTGRNVFYILVMSSVFSGHPKECLPIHVKYELKGTTIDRFVEPSLNDNESSLPTLRDLNMVDVEDCINIGRLSKLFLDTLSRDALFLRSLNIVNYSLLVGIHSIEAHASNELDGYLHFGIVKPFAQETKSSSFSSDREMTMSPSIFTKAHGGVLSDPMSTSTPCIYYIGLVDFLQEYSPINPSMFSWLITSDM